MRWDSVTNIVTGSAATWAQVVAVSVIAPNSDEEQELDATFLTHGVHVNVEPYSPNDVEEIEAPVAGQCSKHVGKQPSHFETSAGKKRKGQPIEYITDAVMEFIDMSRKRRSDKDSDSRKTTVESTPVGDRSLMNSKSPIATERVILNFDPVGLQTDKVVIPLWLTTTQMTNSVIELKRLHLLEEDTRIVSIEESIGTLLYILGHNANMRALRAIHSLGCLIIRPDQDATKLPHHLRGNMKFPHHLRGNMKYYPWFEELLMDFNSLGRPETHTILLIWGMDEIQWKLKPSLQSSFALMKMRKRSKGKCCGLFGASVPTEFRKEKKFQWDIGKKKWSDALGTYLLF
nr:hypothetical protein CFP56_26207 [Quercus suber]